jgi:hypothetical protein
MLDLPKDADFGELDLKIILKIIPNVNDQNLIYAQVFVTLMNSC